MPKETQNQFNVRMVLAYPKVFRCDNSILFCLLCNCPAPATRFSNVKQHFDSKKHLAAVKKKMNESEPKNQTLLTSFQAKTEEINSFNMEICKTFIEANIPLWKVNHPSVKKFIEKHTSCAVPDESTLRKKYVSILFEKNIEHLREKVADKYIWVSLDETQDSMKRYVANFVFGIMDEENDGKSFLLNVQLLEKVNACTISSFFIDSLLILWPNGIFFSFPICPLDDS